MAESVRPRLHGVWRRLLTLSWPIVTEQTLRTLMRTTDVVVTGLFSPAAVAAVGLADPFARLPLRIGLGLGNGAIGLTSALRGSLRRPLGGLAGRERHPDPFVARTTGMFGFLWLFGVRLDWGIEAVYVGIVLYFVWSLLVVAVGFRWGGWVGKAAKMMEKRGSVGDAQ